MVTHEQYIHAIATIAKAKLSEVERKALDGIKLVYGSGPSGTRGVTFFNRWASGKNSPAMPFVEVSAFGQDSPCQLAGTTIHELAHALAGFDAGHGPKWKEACAKLGLRRCQAAGTRYQWASFDPDLRHAVAALAKPSEGQPITSLDYLGPGATPIAFKPCGAGIGTRGGMSRGKGSGSRLRLWQCGCGCKVRVASDTFDATHNPCGTAFAAM